LYLSEDCGRIETSFDELIAGAGQDESRFILTSSHPGKTVNESDEFANSLILKYEWETKIVFL